MKKKRPKNCTPCASSNLHVNQMLSSAVSRLSPQLTYHKLTDIQIKERLQGSHQKASLKAAQLPEITYQVQASLERDPNRIETETRSAGRFVLATNILYDLLFSFIKNY